MTIFFKLYLSILCICGVCMCVHMCCGGACVHGRRGQKKMLGVFISLCLIPLRQDLSLSLKLTVYARLTGQ